MYTQILGLAVIAVAAHAFVAEESPAPREGAAKAEQKDDPGVFRGDVEALAKSSTDFRRVLHTGKHSQLVLMSIRPGESIGLETHEVDQCLFIVDGEGEAIVNGKRSRVDDDSVVCVPAGASHDIVNRDDEAMKLFTVYAPPQHPEGTIHKTKTEAQADEADEHGGHQQPKK
jgi:mannose-6-phosphate isomerase-like protein (cupin superfamily)